MDDFSSIDIDFQLDWLIVENMNSLMGNVKFYE